MFFRSKVGLGYGAHWRGVIFDREYKNLDDLVTKSRRWFSQFNEGAEFRLSAKDYKWVWPTGEELLFRVGYKEADYDQYHGHEYPFIGFNELTKQPSPKFFTAIQSCNRSSFLPLEHSPNLANPLPEIPLVVFATTNPWGPGHNWVKTRIIDKAPPGVIQKIVSRVFNPRTQEIEDITRTQTHLFGTYKENRFLSPLYVATLDAETDPNKRKAWLEGDWDIVAGGALDDVWNKKFQIKPRFKVPKGWRIDRTLDWGSTHPFSVGWWAEANGEEVELPGGVIWCPAPGSYIRLAEWYGTREIGSNEGLKLGSKAIAHGILEREAEMFAGGWIPSTPLAGPADNQIYQVSDKDTETIAKNMEEEGVYWTRSDKSNGSRINGLELVRERLRNSIKGEGAGLYFMDNCNAAISTLPVLPRDIDKPDDVDTESEDHVYDEVRYKCLDAVSRIGDIDSQFPS